MAFQNKVDFFGIAGNGIVLTECNENKAASTVEGHNEKGDIVAFEVFGETMSPDCTYVLSADTQLSGIQCGKMIAGTGDYAGKQFTCGGLTINTSAGQPPSIQANGEEVISANGHTDCWYNFPAATLKQCHHAQILWSAFTLTGDGCYLQQANYTAGGTISKATKNGEPVSYDVTDGKLEVQVTILQTGATKPSLTAGSDWTITSPLNCSSPDADYPTWSATLSRYLEHATS